MSRAKGRALAGFLLAVGLVLIAAGPAAAGPTLEVGDDTIGIGQSVAVTGSGWPPGTLVTLEVCGNGAVDGSVDCHQRSARDVGVRQDGTLATVFRVQRPQGMCPCVIRASSASVVDTVTVPVSVLGVPEGEAKSRYAFPAIQRMLEIRRSELESAGPWTAWFGAAPTPTLVLEVANTGDVPLRNPPLTLTWGKGKEATEFVPPTAEIGDLGPGESRTLRIPVRLESLAFGSYRVEGEIHGLGEPAKFEAKTSSYPWGLFAAALVALQLLLLKLRNKLRRHLVAEEQEAYELALVEQVSRRIPRRPRRTPPEVARGALVTIGRRTERIVARLRRNADAATPAPAATVRTRPIMVAPHASPTANGNGGHPRVPGETNGHRHRTPRDVVSPFLCAIGNPLRRAIQRHERRKQPGPPTKV